MIYLKDNPLAGIKLGEVDIPAVYCGDKRLYPYANETPYISMKASAAQTVTAPSGSTMEYSYNKANWSSMTAAVSFGTTGKETIYIRGKNENIRASFRFGNTTAMIDLGGNIMAILDWENLSDTVPASGFLGTFASAVALKSVSNNFLPATTIGEYGYKSMFDGCISLTSAPSLPATTLEVYCYYGMFSGCSKINEIHCDALNKLLVESATTGWLAGVASAGTFYGNENAPWEMDSPNGVPVGWTSWDSKRSISMTASAAQTVTAPTGKTFQYSYDKTNWSSMTAAVSFGTAGKETVYVRGKNTKIASAFTFSDSSSKVALGGNVMALLDWETLSDEVPNEGFEDLFYKAYALKTVSRGFLPAKIVKQYGYSYMFCNCTALTNTPDLPATSLASRSYNNMFAGCDSLVSAPELPADNLTWHCYESMFSHCDSLTTVPDLPAKTLSDAGCYSSMFASCISLVNAPQILATVLSEGCYQYMFVNCTALTNAPELPVLTLTDTCYMHMFDGCTSLTRTPELPALTLASFCYYAMFSGCSKLNEVYCSAVTMPDTLSATTSWLTGVASKGNFYGESAAVNWKWNSPDGIPVNWGRNEPCAFMTLLPVANSYITPPSGVYLECRISDYERRLDAKWVPFTGAVFAYGTIQMVDIRGYNNTMNGGSFSLSGLSLSRNFRLDGNAMALLNWENVPTKAPANAFTRLFSGATTLIEVAGNLLPATEVGEGAYYGMFGGSGIGSISEDFLPADIISAHCYQKMFENCTALADAPVKLPSEQLRESCYEDMFIGCTNLTTAPTMLATSPYPYCCKGMFFGCKSMTKAPYIYLTVIAEESCEYMFYDCTSLNEIHCDATRFSGSNCVREWVTNVGSTGDFYGKTAAGWGTGISGIPNGWTQHLS